MAEQNGKALFVETARGTMPELLTAVHLVCAEAVFQPHVAIQIDDYLTPTCWTLEYASKCGHVKLLDRLFKLEPPEFNRKCRERRLRWAVECVFRHKYDANVLEWWLTVYMPDQKVFSFNDLYTEAIQHAHLRVLEWLYNQNEGDSMRLEIPVPCSDAEIMVWLYERGGRHVDAKLSLHDHWQSEFDFQSIKQCMVYEDSDTSFTMENAENAVTAAIEHGYLEPLQWLREHRLKLFIPNFHFGLAVRCGQLIVAKWMQESFPRRFFADPCRSLSDSDFSGRNKAKIKTEFCPHSYDFNTIKWVVCEYDWAMKKMSRITWMDDAMLFAARAGNLETLELLYNDRMKNIKLFQAVFALKQRSFFTTDVMDAAATKGHLTIVNWLHEHQCQGSKTKAVYGAAANGHLDVVMWLNQHGYEGFTSSAMDAAASNGYLEVVQWLHDNSSKGCTAMAMDSAAGNGHLSVVRWLHENRSEGCTSDALIQAAANGHLEVVQFLHCNLQEQCSSRAMEQAAAMGHFDTFKWLFANQSERFDPDMNPWIPNEEAYYRILKCQALYTNHDRPWKFVDEFVWGNAYETVQLLLSDAHQNEEGYYFLDIQ